jgi:hypothetical protein
VGAAGLAGYVLARDLRSPVHRIFAAGMVLLAADALLTGLASGAALASDFLFWQQVRTGVAALVPGTWLLFSLCYARANYRSIVARWKIVLSAFLSVRRFLPSSSGSPSCRRPLGPRRGSGSCRWAHPATVSTSSSSPVRSWCL